MANASKIVIILCIVALMVAPLCSAQSGRTIGYGAIRRDIASCGGRTNKPCVGPPANRYSRGCEKSKECRN
ncbi:hypothetical protein CDL15_Pgr029024 [Punica granatum]|uniref:Uncharacterized protein n=1 Tax=Punica granatum TaxID=22663 RepID=A0A218XM95_PUNGR|nr:hypothetical protein CDL15_Pgr029024 [Punica granatum]PKI37409.1 hypothetical protein CRG98_042195 [Punica granatum]